MPLKAYRQEIKQLLSPAQALLLEQRIRAVLAPDTHSGPDGSYHIRSIYFDTLNDRAYTEKEAGICERDKLRIRFYNYQDRFIQLERKEKRENLIYKEALTISRDTALSLLDNRYQDLLSYRHPLADYMYTKSCSEGLHPAVVVDYMRRAYVYPAGNVRITFDSGLCAGRPGIPLWNDSGGFDVMNGSTILEIKFNQYLPEHVRRLLSSVPGTRMALSKYTLCRQNLLWKQGDFIGGKK